jgi:hypothetical protein
MGFAVCQIKNEIKYELVNGWGKVVVEEPN